MYLLLMILTTFNIYAARLVDSPFFKAEVIFTNPICATYIYSEPITANDGSSLIQKPQNVYCKKSDYKFNKLREGTPQRKIVDLIHDKNLEKIFLTYLSFSDDEVLKALCQAVEERNIAVTFIIDSKNKERSSGLKRLNALQECKPKNVSPSNANFVQTFLRGNKGGFGYAHNKLIMADFKNSSKRTIVFSSGNMSSGTTMHHENWVFITLSNQTYFSKAHDCLREAMIHHSEKKMYFKQQIKKCRDAIELDKEEDITFYIVPSDGKLALEQIYHSIDGARSIQLAAHRFTLDGIKDKLILAAQRGADVKMVAEDDLYYVSKKDGRFPQVAASNRYEFYKVAAMAKNGVDVRYFETNHREWLLQHNKFFIFEFEAQDDFVFTGAGNFTKAAFSKNYENFYLIRIPQIVNAYKTQYLKMFHQMATPWEKLPVKDVKPVVSE